MKKEFEAKLMQERIIDTKKYRSRGQIPLPWLGSNDALPLATRMETRLPWRPTRGSLTSPSYLVQSMGWLRVGHD